MGSLNRFDLARYRGHYGLNALFETGTFHGDGVQAAIEAGFDRIISVEIIDEYFTENRKRFAHDDRVQILHGESRWALEEILPGLEGPIFFWLDAHFPGADGGLRDHNAEPDEAVRCPLESELEIIRQHRPHGLDVILCDDLRLYETGPFEHGDLHPAIRRPPGDGIDFINRLFGDTHHVLKLFYDEGYVLLLPIAQVPKIYVRREAPRATGEIARLMGWE